MADSAQIAPKLEFLLVKPAASDKSMSEVVLEAELEKLTQTFRPYLPKFLEGKGSKMPGFSTPVDFEALWFQKKQHI